MLKLVLVVVLAKRVAPPRPSKSTKMASPSSMLAHASNASLASTIAPLAPSPKANNSGFIETLNPSVASQDVALFFFVRRLCARFTARIRRRLRLCARFTARIRLRISAISPPGLNTPLWRRLFRRLGSIHRRCRAMCSFHCAHTHGVALRATLPKSSYLKCTKFRLQ